MQEKLWETRAERALKEYRLAAKQWQKTKHPFFRNEMKYRAVIYRACSALSTEQGPRQASSRSLLGRESL